MVAEEVKIGLVSFQRLKLYILRDNLNKYIFMLTILNWLCDHFEYIDIIPQVCGIPCPSFTLRSTRVLWSMPHLSAEILEAD